MDRIMTRDVGSFAEGRFQFDDFGRYYFERAAEIFPQSGYYRIDTPRHTQEHSVAFSISSFRGNKTKTTLVKSTRLEIELIETFRGEMGNSKDPRIDEVQIPGEMARWAPAPSTLTGAPAPDQDMVSHFSIELARGGGRNSSLYALRGRRPFGGSLGTDRPILWPGTRHMEENASLPQTTTRAIDVAPTIRPDLSPVLIGRGGGRRMEGFRTLISQMARLGALLSIASAGNSMADMAYDRSVRMAVEKLEEAHFRRSADQTDWNADRGTRPIEENYHTRNNDHFGGQEDQKRSDPKNGGEKRHLASSRERKWREW